MEYVYVWQNKRGRGDNGVSKTLAGAQEALKTSMLTSRGITTDPDPWDGYEWRVTTKTGHKWRKNNDDPMWLFSGIGVDDDVEGTVERFPLMP